MLNAHDAVRVVHRPQGPIGEHCHAQTISREVRVAIGAVIDTNCVALLLEMPTARLSLPHVFRNGLDGLGGNLGGIRHGSSHLRCALHPRVVVGADGARQARELCDDCLRR